MIKLAAAAASVLVSLGLTSFLPPPEPPDDGPPPPRAKRKEDAKAKRKGEAKKKEDRGPESDLRRAYDLLRRLRADSGSAGRPEERLRDWSDRATKLYRDGLKALKEGDERLAHEYGIAAHDLARAVDHARNAARFDKTDSELPPPPDGDGPEDSGERVRRDLRRAYDRIREAGDDDQGPEAEFYLKAAKDLYKAARRDVEDGRADRAGELARASEAMTHVPDHLTHAGDRRGPRGERPEPRKPRPERRGDDLPPPLPE